MYSINTAHAGLSRGSVGDRGGTDRVVCGRAGLARHGVRCRIFEQALTPHTQTRATEIQPAVMEVFHRAGLAEKFLESSLPRKGQRIFDANMEEAYVFSIPAADSLYPTTRSMPQWRTEEILTENLTALGSKSNGEGGAGDHPD